LNQPIWLLDEFMVFQKLARDLLADLLREKGKGKSGRGSLGSARFGPGAAAQRGSWRFERAAGVEATLARGAHDVMHARVGSRSDGAWTFVQLATGGDVRRLS
jgi:hypothetical protein